MPDRIYFVRYVNMVGDNRFEEPRTRPSVRRSLGAGTLGVLAFTPETVPSAWKDGRTAGEMSAFLSLPEHEGVWWIDEEP